MAQTLVNTIDYKPILAQRAKNDINGRSIPDTYATYDYVNRKTVADFGTSVYGEMMTDENDTPILDEEGNCLYSEDSVELYTSFREKGFGAERATADEEGNDIVATYATKSELAVVEEKIGSIADGGTLTDASVVNVNNNALSRLTTSQSSLTLNVELGNGEIANFAVEVSAGADVTLAVTSTTDGISHTLRPSAAGGNSMANGKFYQVTCVGSCWTLAEFDTPSP